MERFTVRLERVFHGPMDLLLHLVREQEVEIQDVEITSVVEGYMEYLEHLKDLDIEVAGEFLVLAATLLSIKSRSLLPREEVDLADELDPRDELVQRLIEYRHFKEASDNLEAARRERMRTHGRGSFDEVSEKAGEVEVTLDLGELTAWDLLSTFSRLLRETLADRPHAIASDPRPMRWFVRELASWISEAGDAPLSACVTAFCAENPTKEEMVGSFCALLELIKLGVVAVEAGPEGGLEDPVVSLRDGVEGDVTRLLDAARFDDEEEAEDGEPEAAPEGEEPSADAGEQPAPSAEEELPREA
ncbi:MAG: segregation/condensation protein A [Planctomycetes bacterium]|nr:segregation/condensation protein A [Planctomycetota bacterium]